MGRVDTEQAARAPDVHPGSGWVLRFLSLLFIADGPARADALLVLSAGARGCSFRPPTASR